MRNVVLAAAALAVLVGCGSSSSGDDTAVKGGSGVALNPGGKPQTPADASREAAMQQQGTQMNDARAQAAAAEAAAKAKTGGK